MSTFNKWIVFLLVILLLAAACGQQEPTATPVPPTATTIAMMPTGTSSPPTATPVAPTDTPVLPTDTPIPATEEPPPTVTPTTEPSPSAIPLTEPATPSRSWIKTYGGEQNTIGGDILLADDGGYFIVGTTNLQFEPEQQGDVYLIRTDAAGEILWEKTYGGEGYDGGRSVTLASDGSLLIAGATTSFGAEGFDAYLLKVDQDGNELWSKTYGGPLDEMVGAVGQNADGSLILGGNIVDPNDFVTDPGTAGYGGFAGRSNPYLLKVDADGNELWSRRYDSEDNVLASSGLQTPDGGFLALAGIIHFPDPDQDIQLLKLDGDGNVTWSRTWEEGISNPYDLVATSDGNYLITASYAPLGDDKEDYLFIKIDPEGNEIWKSTFGDPDLIDYGVVLAETADGGFITVGERTKDRYTWEADRALVKIDGNGQLLWQQIEPGSHTMFSCILEHPDGGIVIAGGTFRDPVFNLLLIKTDSAESAQGASPPAPSAAAAALIAHIEDLAAQDQFSGAVLIAQGEEPVFKGAYGLADRSSELPNQVDTKFNLGSMNKMFTATAILQLAEQGKLSVDDKIIDHLPDYANQEVAGKVTIDHLLTHTSGMGNVFTDKYDMMPKDQFRTPEDWLPLFVDTPLQFEPGAQFAYSNAGYVVLGLILERVTGQSYYDYVMDEIFEPSGMLNSDSYARDEDVPNLAIGYTTQGYDGNELREPIANTDRLPARGFPAGGGYSTVEDLLKFRNALLGHQMLSPESTDLLLTGKIELREDLQYAYGFFDRMVGSQRVVGHSGGFPGICDFMDIYLDLGVTVVVLSNSDEGCIPVLEFLREQPLE